MNIATSADPDNRPADLFATRALLQRPAAAPNLQAEAAAFGELSKLLADDPHAALRRFPEVALHLCNAGTAGLSLLRSNAAGQAMVHWQAVSGALASRQGIDTPRNFSPCGLCLDAGATILLSRPERVFTYLRWPQPLIEDLIVPLQDGNGRPLGTFWIAHHDFKICFSANDARIMEQLAIYLVVALKLLQQAGKRRRALALFRTQKTARRKLAHDLARECGRRKRAEAAASSIRETVSFKDTLIHEVHHRVKNTLQIASSLLSLQARTTPVAEVQQALQQSCTRLHLLAKVHELLYLGADNTQEIPISNLLQTIANGLRQSFAEASAGVTLLVSSDAVMLAPDAAIPLALLANELLTNAYKHAFPGGSCGEITVSLHRAPEDTLVLHIADNGIGMRANSNTHGLGLKLVRTFATQLRGTLVFAEPVDATGTDITLTTHRTGIRMRPSPAANDRTPP